MFFLQWHQLTILQEKLTKIHCDYGDAIAVISYRNLFEKLNTRELKSLPIYTQDDDDESCSGDCFKGLGKLKRTGISLVQKAGLAATALFIGVWLSALQV